MEIISIETQGCFASSGEKVDNQPGLNDLSTFDANWD